MRIVLDTNILVSALLNPTGAPAAVFGGVVDGAITLLADNRILFEYGDVLTRPAFGFDVAETRVLLDFLKNESEPVLPTPVPLPLPDPDDAPFYEVAKSGNARFLVTGNLKHYPEKEWIVPPSRFLKLYLDEI